MSENAKLVPKRRFKEFQNADGWEQRKFSEIAETRRGLTYNPTNIRGVGIRVLRSSNINEDQFTVGMDDVFVGIEAINIPFVKNRDILITSANGSSRLVGKHALIRGIHENSTVHGGFMLAASTKFPEFLNASMSSPWYSKFINLFVAGGNGAIGNLSKSDLDEQLISIPAEDEQQQIGAYFEQLDNLITLHQGKLEKMKALKLAYLSEMFPAECEREPKRRCKGFTDAWEQRKLGELIVKLSGGASIAPNDYQEDGVRTIPKGAVNSTGVANLSGSKYVTKQFFERNISSIASANNIVTSLRDLVPTAPNMGRIVRIVGVKEDFLMPQGVYKIELNDRTDENFVIAYSNSERYRKIISSEKNGSTQVHIRNGEFLNIDISTPSYDEQKKIGTFFNNLDNLITLYERKLEKLQNIKQAFLNEMFI